MALPFSIGAVTEFLVVGYDGFDRDQSATMVRLLGDGSSRGDEVMQQGSLPFRRATLTGESYTKADVDLLRSYNDTKELVSLRDGDGVWYAVRFLDFGARSFTGRWTWTAVLVSVEDVEVTPDPVVLELRIPEPSSGAGVAVGVVLTPSPVALVTAVPVPTVSAL